jgi:uncharacterized protein (TIGR03437 family)
MQFRRYISLVATFLVFAATVSAQSAKSALPRIECGTSPALRQQEFFLHKKAVQRRAQLLRAGRSATTSSGTVLDLQRSAATPVGDILVMSRDGGVTLSRNPFSGSQLFLNFRFTPTDAAASSYRVEPPTGGTFRSDAIQEPAVNLIRPGQPDSMRDDDAREFSLPFPFPYQGKTYDKMFVHSNGFVSFEETQTAGFDLSYTDFLSGPPKIMPAGIDLDPEDAPADAGLYVFTTSTEAIISWVRIPEFLSASNLVDMQLRLGSDGSIQFFHRSLFNGQFVMGITPGRNLSAGTLIDFNQPPSGELTGAIAEVFTDPGEDEVDILRATEVFLESQPDDYDFVVFFNNIGVRAGATALAYEITIRNQVTGIGDDETDFSELFGSSGRLQAVLNMGPLQMYPANPTELVPMTGSAEYTSLGLLAHETGHRFLAFPRLREPGGDDTLKLLGRGLAHWSFNFNAQASFMEGSDVRSTGKVDDFITGPPSLRYSELDKYLMGLIGREQVGGDAPGRQNLYYVDALTTGARAPRRDVSLTGPARNFNIFDVIAANGPRIPDHTVSQKRFRMAFVLISQNTTASEADLQKLNALRTAFETFFREQTGQLAIVDTSLKPGLLTDVFPAAGLVPGAQGQITVRRTKTTATAVPLTLTATGDAVTLPTGAEIPANAASVTIPVTGANAGISTVLVSAADGSYTPEALNIAVRNLGDLELQLLSGARYQAEPNAETTFPVQVRVQDANRLPYQGVEVRLEPTSGGSANPVPALTNAQGEATIRWTVGGGTQNQAVLFLAGNRGGTERNLVAVQSLQPSVAAATNGASFTPGLSPGSLGTLFGSSMAAGSTQSAVSQPLPTEIAGTSVRINGLPAALLYVSDLQINFVVPQSVTGTTALVVVESSDGESTAFEATLRPYDPAIFFDSGTNLGAVLRSGSGQKTNVVPALPGSFVEIFATGLGPLISPRRGVLVTDKPVTATLNGQAMEVSYSGIAPGFVGLYQINAKVPDGLAPGTYSLLVQQEGRESNAVNVIVGAP